MQVEALNITGTNLQQLPRASDVVKEGRKNIEKVQVESQESSAPSKEVQPEELLSQIKSLTDDGLYSVRFENSQEFNELIVKVVDLKTDEVIRQVPAEEILGVRAVLSELRGNLVDTVR